MDPRPPGVTRAAVWAGGGDMQVREFPVPALGTGEMLVRVTLATVLREGVTNLLRHSKAERCEIVLSSSPRLVTMDIINDGLAASERNSRNGSGIGNLTTRVCALGGSLDAGPTSERTFRLHAEIPLG